MKITPKVCAGAIAIGALLGPLSATAQWNLTGEDVATASPRLRQRLNEQVRPNVLAEFPFQLRGGLIWIQVQSPRSRKPLQFLLDSGAGVSVLNLDTARRLHLNLGGEVAVEGVEGSAKGFWPQHLDAEVGGLKLPEEYLALDIRHLRRECGRGVDGLVGADFFSGHIVRIGYASRTIQVLRAACPSATSEVVRLEPQVGGLRIPVSVDGGQEQWARLDTGCATALEWVTSSVSRAQASSQIAVALSGQSWPMGRTSLRLGKVSFASVLTGFHAQAMFSGESGLVGNGVLGRFSAVTVDARGGRLILDAPGAEAFMNPASGSLPRLRR